MECSDCENVSFAGHINNTAPFSTKAICFISNGIAVPVLEAWPNVNGCLQI